MRTAIFYSKQTAEAFQQRVKHLYGNCDIVRERDAEYGLFHYKVICI